MGCLIVGRGDGPEVGARSLLERGKGISERKPDRSQDTQRLQKRALTGDRPLTLQTSMVVILISEEARTEE